ncbi:MAG: hypothetical protein HWD63_13765 [Candidatus Parvibacillus calidus]|nr:MAG: hypothetical protein HWD63_13765 [Candidatus Parvibacillus calidus]
MGKGVKGQRPVFTLFLSGFRKPYGHLLFGRKRRSGIEVDMEKKKTAKAYA